MSALTVTQARSDLYNIIDKVAVDHEPIHIIGKRSSAVIVNKEDWDAIKETLYLCSIPGMRESIIEGMKTPLIDCVEDIDW